MEEEFDFMVTKENKGKGESSKDSSLQANFSKFLQEKKQERRLLQSIANNVERTEEFKQNLRNKFINQAKSYFGVPYAEKYQPEGAAKLPLYLDCCGLVRQCLKDLRTEFGFVTGKWNQAYQFDTLPIRYDSVDKLKPGDLIFYAGEYTSNRSKMQKHDMVHVEIFYGGETGEATIGARFSKGVVQIWPSYKFDSTLWKLHSYYYCSIDTWLEGECVSHCAEHEWKCSAAKLALAAGERSIFNDNEEEEKQSDDESAGGGELSDTEENAVEETTNDEECILMLPKKRGVSAKKVRKPRKSTSEKIDKPDKIDNRNKFNNVNSYYVCKSNGWKLVVAALDKRGWHQMPFDYSFSTRYQLKWVERRSQIDYKAHQPGQLVNHIINNDVLTTKNGLLSALREYYCQDNSSTSSGISGEDEIAGVLTKLLHGQPIDGNFSCPRVPTPWLPESYQLDSVVDCVALLLEDSEASKHRVGTRPDASTTDVANALAATGLEEMVKSVPTPPTTPHRVKRKSKAPTHLWIYKPSASNRGRGVKMVQGGNDLIDCIKEYHPIIFANGIAPGTVKKFERPKPAYHDEDFSPKGKGATFALPPPKAMIQHYLMNPLLIEGFKFDMRCYMLITRTSPTYKAYFHPGYCRRTLRKFSLDVESLTDEAVHLSNVSVQRKLPDYKERVASQVS